VASEVTYRPISTGDSIEALTQMLHRAYGPLAEAGMRFTASYQTEETTLFRLGLGETIVASVEERVVGTVTIHRPEPTSPFRWYARPDVASMHQLAVEPDFQGRGIGRRLITLAEDLARTWGVQEIALDTSEHALALIALYERHGYRYVERIKHRSPNYHSVVMSKLLRALSTSVGSASR
jgi:ribosomal protein S18 acetylase RimI-like enzyme